MRVLDEFDPRELWRKVVAQAVRDALSTWKDVDSAHNRRTARAWFASNSEDFREVCEMAELNPAHVKESMKETILAQDEGEFTAIRERCGKQKRKEASVRSDRRGRIGAIYIMDGIEDTIPGWARRMNIPPYSIANRLNSGKQFEVAIKEAVEARKSGRLRGRPVSKR
ncbi:hypothetical protein M673_12717 [Aureimonas sp. AU20]|nr:hypothetical protein M673_12717 [Aureimonas sp. AU20]